MIRNYLGFPRGISGMRLAQRARFQATRFGTQFITGWDVAGLTPSLAGEPHLVHTEGGDLRARSVVVATGASYRKLGVSGDRGVDGQRCFLWQRDDGGAARWMVSTSWSSAVETRPARPPCTSPRFAKTVTIAVRRDGLGATMSRYLIDEIDYNGASSVQTCCEVIDGGGAARLEWLDVRDTVTGDVVRRNCEGLFLLLGAEPRCEWLPAAVTLDDRGFVLTGRDVPQDAWVDGLPPESLATSVPGIFAVGDVRAGSMKRVAAASGEGSSVVPLVHAYLESI